MSKNTLGRIGNIGRVISHGIALVVAVGVLTGMIAIEFTNAKNQDRMIADKQDSMITSVGSE